jgi:hypothetical protein
MDLIERVFNVAPDGGYGTLEVMIALLLLVVAYSAVRRLAPPQRSRIS